MRLNDDIETASPDKTISARKGEIERPHDFRYADGGTPRNSDTTVN